MVFSPQEPLKIPYLLGFQNHMVKKKQGKMKKKELVKDVVCDTDKNRPGRTHEAAC